MRETSGGGGGGGGGGGRSFPPPRRVFLQEKDFSPAVAHSLDDRPAVNWVPPPLLPPPGIFLHITVRLA